MNRMKSLQALSCAMLLLAAVGCSNPADHVPAASVGKALDAGAAPTSGGQPFKFGPDSGSIEFVGSKVTGSHNGGFRNFAGEFHVANGRVTDSGNRIVIDASSLWADDNRLTGHLKTADFFNVGQFPTATFVTTSVKQSNGDATITGDLTLHGVTKSISFPAKIGVTGNAVDVTAEFAINRFDFEIIYPGKANDLIRKEVVLKLKVKAAPGKADFNAVERPSKQGKRMPRPKRGRTIIAA